MEHIEDDDLLREFLAESREHLADIEADLLAIEERGADIDEGIVNKVFRAAHSIKGGSGFFGLSRIQELAHGAETVLALVRSREMVPNAEVVNILLQAFDRLRDLVNAGKNSNNADISAHAAALVQLSTSYLAPDAKGALDTLVEVSFGGGAALRRLPEIDVKRARSSGQHLYLMRYDLLHDIERAGKTPLDIINELVSLGEILDASLNLEAVGTLEEDLAQSIPLDVVFATVIEPDLAGALASSAFIPVERVLPMDPVPSTVPPKAAMSAPAPAPKPAQEAVTPPARLATTPPPALAPSEEKSATPSEVSSSAASSGDETIRVNVSVLENLMNLAGELVLSRNQLRASIAQKNEQSLAVADQRINQVTSELQDAIMQTRLQPIGTVFAKFPRVVRDMAGKLGKDILLDIRGKDVALDKSLIEGLSDPLTHMVRNAVDHGIEGPEDRTRAGKKAQGTVRIDACHEAGQVVVEIADDGKGLDPERIAKAALSKNLISQERLMGMSAQEKAALVFLPGLSTAEKVTDISGRGVGMDVVKTNLDRLGGKVEIVSEVGKGTTFRIKLPLTLAIIPSLIFSLEEERFAIPQINVEELLRVRPDAAKTRIEVVGDAEVLVLRERLIPLVRFADLLGVFPSYRDRESGQSEVDRRVRLADRRSARHAMDRSASPAAGGGHSATDIAQRSGADRRSNPSGDLEIAVVTTGTQTYGLVVGEFKDNEEIVVKPLGRHLKGLSEYAGATILGDGTVALILDIAGLAAKADLAAVSGTARAREQAHAAEMERLADVHALLLFHNAPDEFCATPLDTVLRVERIAPERVETIGGRRTMQYRGGALPLVALADVARVKDIGDTRDLAVIVSRVRNREVGLLGAMPVDVIETAAVIDQVTHRQKGIVGSTIINEHTTLIADMFELVDTAFPEWQPEKREEDGARPMPLQESGLSSSGKTESLPGCAVLLAEDSDFFRNQVQRFMEEEGYTVLAAPDGEAAWELLLENIERVRVVVTDIEMPRLTGTGLAQRIRADQRTAHLPIIAVTSLAGDDDIARGKAMGINDYQVKLDRDCLMERVRDFWTNSPVIS